MRPDLPGDQGPAGPPGAAGLDYMPATFVGREACQEFHKEIYATYMETGHPFIMSKVVDGKAPVSPLV